MKKGLSIIFILLMLTACGGKSSNPTPGGGGGTGGGGTGGGGTTNPPAPSQVTLVSPNENEVCTTGTIVSDTISTITFTWDASANTDTYGFYLKNLLTNATITKSTNQTSLSLNIKRNTPYSWYIISNSSTTTATAQSDTWKFYNAGLGTVTYPPYPAEITSPTFGEDIITTDTTVNLTWKGSAVNNTTIINYDVYFGTNSSPGLFKSKITNEYLDNVSVTSKTTYYWKVITRDVFGNISDSGIYQFTVN